MRIDKSHLPWLAFSAAVLAGSAVLYSVGARTVHGPGGGSRIGITLGSVALAFLLFAGALAPRRKFRTRQIGRAQWWLAGHLWLGALTLPLAWFHGGFHHGGALTAAVMWLLYIVVLSGLAGAALQHFVPRHLRADARLGIDYSRLSFALGRLAAEAQDVLESARGPAFGQTWEQRHERNLTVVAAGADAPPPPMARESARETPTARRAASAAAAGRMSEGTGDGMAELAGFYDREIKPYLAGSPKDPATLVEDETASLLFDLQRESTPLALQETLDQWERICADARRLYAQRRVHRLLHGWLIVHVPLSAALVVLVIVHAVMAIRFI